MINTRTLGFGLALAFGLLVAKPAPADEACQKTLADIAKATATLTSLQQLRGDIAKHQASQASAGPSTAPAPTEVAVATTVKCDACGMMMPSAAKQGMRRAVKIHGHTYYCCRGCDMSKQVDKK